MDGHPLSVQLHLHEEGVALHLLFHLLELSVRRVPGEELQTAELAADALLFADQLETQTLIVAL